LSTPKHPGRWVWGLVLALFLLHQDFWLWDDPRLVLGFLPVGLAYHAGYSIATAAVWTLAVRFAWPTGMSEAADSPAGTDSDGEG